MWNKLYKRFQKNLPENIEAALHKIIAGAELSEIKKVEKDIRRGCGKGGCGGSSSARNDYKNFQNCLSDAEGTKGYAIEKEVRGCFNPIYNTGTSGCSSSTGSGNNDNSDTNSPRS